MLPVAIERRRPLAGCEARTVLRPDATCDLEPEKREKRERKHTKRQQDVEDQMRGREPSKRERGQVTGEGQDLEHDNSERDNQIAEAREKEKHERGERHAKERENEEEEEEEEREDHEDEAMMMSTAWPPQGLVLGQAPGPRCSTIPLAGRAEHRLCVLTGLDPKSFRRAFDCRNVLPFFPGSQRGSSSSSSSSSSSRMRRRRRSTTAAAAGGDSSESDGRTTTNQHAAAEKVLRGQGQGGGSAKRKRSRSTPSRANGTRTLLLSRAGGVVVETSAPCDDASGCQAGASAAAAAAAAACGELGGEFSATSPPTQADTPSKRKAARRCIATKTTARGVVQLKPSVSSSSSSSCAPPGSRATKAAKRNDDAKKGDHFPLSDARANLRWQASQGLFEERRLIVLLGTKVAAAVGFAPCRRLFDAAWATIDGVSGMPQLASSSGSSGHHRRPGAKRGSASSLLDLRLRAGDFSERLTLFVVFPHPSGVSHYWNTAANICRAQRFMASAIELSRVLRPPPPPPRVLYVAPESSDDCKRLFRCPAFPNKAPREWEKGEEEEEEEHEHGQRACTGAEVRRVSRFFIHCRCLKHRVWCTKCCLSPERHSKYF